MFERAKWSDAAGGSPTQVGRLACGVVGIFRQPPTMAYVVPMDLLRGAVVYL